MEKHQVEVAGGLARSRPQTSCKYIWADRPMLAVVRCCMCDPQGANPNRSLCRGCASEYSASCSAVRSHAHACSRRAGKCLVSLPSFGRETVSNDFELLPRTLRCDLVQQRYAVHPLQTSTKCVEVLVNRALRIPLLARAEHDT